MTMTHPLPTSGPVYCIRIRESLGEEWAEWFAPFRLMTSEHGGTLIVGAVRDQAALHGLLARLRDLNLTLVSCVSDT